jgi:hypothetical protein
MRRKAFSFFLTLLLVAGLAALAQSPTSSNPGGSETKDPYGATLDHPNPGSPNPAREGQTPATGKTTVTGTTTTEPSTSSNSMTSTTDTAPSTSTTTSTTDTTPSTSATTPSDMNNSSASSGRSLPRTASELPLLATIGLLSLGAALMVRSIARRDA